MNEKSIIAHLVAHRLRVLVRYEAHAFAARCLQYACVSGRSPVNLATDQDKRRARAMKSDLWHPSEWTEDCGGMSVSEKCVW